MPLFRFSFGEYIFLEEFDAPLMHSEHEFLQFFRRISALLAFN